MRSGKYKGIGTARPIEIAHGRCTIASENVEVYDNIDLTLEGQAAWIHAIHWNILQDTVFADANDDLYELFALLSMNESLSNSTFNTDQNALLDDENTLDFFTQSFQNVLTTSGQTIIPWGKSEWHQFPMPLLAPETIRMGVALIDGGNIQSQIDCMVYYQRIEKPTQAMKDYFYRRR